MLPKFYIGPMSKNVVDSIIEFTNETDNKIGLIPSRRQIEYDGGYVNNWTTKMFYNYIQNNKGYNLILERDHAGPNQGKNEDDGLFSLKEDCSNFNIIHLDPWKRYLNLNEGMLWTLNMINYCLDINPYLLIEIGTEEAIRKFELDELYQLINYLKINLKEDKFKQIKYVVIQCGTSLEGINQTGKYDKQRLIEQISLAKSFGLYTKEHNGDYQPIFLIKEKFELGLDAVNIAPEFGIIETSSYMDEIIKNWDFGMVEHFWKICYDSKKWVKWVKSDFDPFKLKYELIKICGHYMFSTPEFEIIKNKYQIDDKIKQNIKKKLYELYS